MSVFVAFFFFFAFRYAHLPSLLMGRSARFVPQLMLDTSHMGKGEMKLPKPPGIIYISGRILSVSHLKKKKKTSKLNTRRGRKGEKRERRSSGFH